MELFLLLLFGKGIQRPRTELEGGEAIQTVGEDAFTAVIPDIITIFELRVNVIFKCYILFVVGAVAGGGDAVMTVGGPFNSITAEVFSNI